LRSSTRQRRKASKGFGLLTAGQRGPDESAVKCLGERIELDAVPVQFNCRIMGAAAFQDQRQIGREPTETCAQLFADADRPRPILPRQEMTGIDRQQFVG
jgi:hypothetical protein